MTASCSRYCTIVSWQQERSCKVQKLCELVIAAAQQPSKGEEQQLLLTEKSFERGRALYWEPLGQKQPQEVMDPSLRDPAWAQL